MRQFSPNVAQAVQSLLTGRQGMVTHDLSPAERVVRDTKASLEKLRCVWDWLMLCSTHPEPLQDQSPPQDRNEPHSVLEAAIRQLYERETELAVLVLEGLDVCEQEQADLWM